MSLCIAISNRLRWQSAFRIAPIIKLASNNRVFERMNRDIDLSPLREAVGKSMAGKLMGWTIECGALEVAVEEFLMNGLSV